MHLVEEPSVVDPTYIEDFLLTYRTFLSNPMEVGRKLLDWFQVDSLRDTVCVVVCIVLRRPAPSPTSLPPSYRLLTKLRSPTGH